MKSTLRLFSLLFCLLTFSQCYQTFHGERSNYDMSPLQATEKSAQHLPQSEEPKHNREDYAHIVENDFQNSKDHPLSTFSIDVDNASYSNVRRFLSKGQKPPVDAIRIEELINYFSYQYPQPKGEIPFSVSSEMGTCPWNTDHRLLRIGIQGREVAPQNIPPSNLVFLLDVSGSMGNYDKLPLLKSAFRMLVRELRASDRVAIVVYAGASGLVLPSTSGDKKQKILRALDRLESGGSTAGASGINLAYKVAREHWMEDGNNRIILATDGDFNVGQSSESGLIRLIENQRRSGIFLSVLGFGTGNLQDSKMEKIANNGNGNYSYIDNIQEARKVLVQERSSTLLTIAKDVKLQLEFNPTQVKEYRLIGYENRMLRAEDFNNDQKDAGELGAGHSVTALYEIIPTTATESTQAESIDPLKYQEKSLRSEAFKEELLTLKLRYKLPNENDSQLLSSIIKEEEQTLKESSPDFHFAAAVAGFGMLLRGSQYSGKANWEMVEELGKTGKGKDPHGYRSEFLKLVQMASGNHPVAAPVQAN